MRAASDIRAKTSAKEIFRSNSLLMTRRRRGNNPSGWDKSRARVRSPKKPTTRATYADLLTIGALFIAIILVVTLGFQYTLG